MDSIIEYNEMIKRGEKNLLSKFLILRTSWVFSEDKNNFISKVLQLCLEKESFEVISDQVGTPTSANYLAIITKKLVEYYIKNRLLN